MSPTREQILAASAGWVAVVLNVVPGLGASYLYQRRWKAYWITSALATSWFVAGAALGQNADAAAEIGNFVSAKSSHVRSQNLNLSRGRPIKS